jgi:hypothetical protein
MAKAADEMFGNRRVAYIHVRSASNNCYRARIDRRSRFPLHSSVGRGE